MLAEFPRAAWIFAALALVFAALALRDYRRTGGAQSPRRKSWVRLAVIFAAVTIVIVATRPT